MIRAILHGCNGNMGQVISELVEKESDFQIVAGIDERQEKRNEYPVFGAIGACEIKADVVIDFSNVSAIDDLLSGCVEKKIPLVLCTTGLTPEQLESMKEISKKIPVFHSANMSLGIHFLSNLLKEAARRLVPMGFDVEIVEKHHNQKEDAPSGTAVTLANVINDELGQRFTYCYDRSQSSGKRAKDEIGISSVRGGTIVGEHEVIFAGEEEVLTFRHISYSKAVFAKGAIEAAKFLAGKDAGLYEMKDLL